MDSKLKLKDACLLITGGTGSFGTAMLRHFIETDISEIRIFSRDEKKQDDMRKKFGNDKLKFYIGDVRDECSVRHAMFGVNFVFHAAALKQVPSCEFYPIEAIKTNILGTENVLNAAIREKVDRVVCLSTDKAVYPINAMGMTKALMEKVMIAATRPLDNSQTVICGTRYGNVMASRGSVIPLFLQQILKGEPLTITDRNMTRFMMSLDDAVELVLYAFEHGRNGDLFVQKSPGVTIEILAKSLLELIDERDHPIREIGTRHGEKLYETLLGIEELSRAEDLGDYFCVRPDARDLNYGKYTDFGDLSFPNTEGQEGYNSHNTRQLSCLEMQDLLKNLAPVRAFLDGKGYAFED